MTTATRTPNWSKLTGSSIESPAPTPSIDAARPDRSGRSIRVCDVPEFAKDVRAELMREEEDGSSPLTNVLDKACLDAWEEGSIGCHD